MIALTAVVVGGPLIGLGSAFGAGQLWNVLNVARQSHRHRRRIAVDAATGPTTIRINQVEAERTRLAADDDGGFAVVVPAARDGGGGGRWRSRVTRPPGEIRFTGREALLAASRILPHVNRTAGTAADVRAAVALVDDVGASGAVYATIARDFRRHRRAWAAVGIGDAAADAFGGLTPAARLALEMAAHEEQERRAMEGELRELEAAWQQAEEIAAIADDLLLPSGVRTKLDQLKARSSARAGAASSPSSDSGGASSS
jgi:hypothetical protein